MGCFLRFKDPTFSLEFLRALSRDNASLPCVSPLCFLDCLALCGRVSVLPSLVSASNPRAEGKEKGCLPPATLETLLFHWRVLLGVSTLPHFSLGVCGCLCVGRCLGLGFVSVLLRRGFFFRRTAGRLPRTPLSGGQMLSCISVSWTGLLPLLHSLSKTSLASEHSSAIRTLETTAVWTPCSSSPVAAFGLLQRMVSHPNSRQAAWDWDYLS